MMRTHYAARVTPEMDGKEVTLAGWAHEIRDIGKIKFLVLRDRTGIIQVTAKRGIVPDEIVDSIAFVKETVVQVKGKVVVGKGAKAGVEIIPTEKVVVLGPVSTTIPFEVTGKVPAELDVRLDNRYVDLRRIETTAIFNIRSVIEGAFREKLLGLDFQEITPPCVVAAATEGGTNLFKVEYFEKEAFLAQSPQLYKQMAIVGGMDKVFMTTPVFRAEKHNTVAHLNEVLQMDIEMGFCDHNDAMDILGDVAIHIIKRVKESCAKELAILGREGLKVPEKVNRYTYTEMLEKLAKLGSTTKWGEDFTKEDEKKMPEALGEELFIVSEWPTDTRAFYSMPTKEDPKICHAYDLVYMGMEVASGAQRVHIPELLVEQLKGRGMNPENFEFYVRAFRMGAPPHAGWSIGLDRMAMAITGVGNIRECTLFPRDRVRLTP
ncbi:MAG: aspartate--tRNA(Asn) ligase [Candidatus Micrarchaeota archaeon]